MASPLPEFAVKLMPPAQTIFIGGVPWWYIRHYFYGRTSLFRHYQNLLMEKYGHHFEGEIIELGCERHYQNQRFFPNATIYHCSNIGRDYDRYLDITAMDLPDASQDGYVCISVLEHVKDFQTALAEIHRTLKPGGHLLITVPFIYHRHDQVDYWRFSENFYTDFFADYEIIAFAHLGGRLATIADILLKPSGKMTRRSLPRKLLGILFVLLARYADIQDDYPLGYGIYAVKRSSEQQ